jgi:holo-[acyl-carrier protein] synthase
MIIGVGIDLEEIARIADLSAKWGERFERKLFTDGERAFCRARAHTAQHFAARFAAKEATLKALRVPPGLKWHELEVVHGGKAAPRLSLTGEAAAVAARLGVRATHLTITHAAGVAAAVVILES